MDKLFLVIIDENKYKYKVFNVQDKKK